MKDIAFPFWALYQVLENRLVLAEAIRFAEVSRVGGDRGRLREVLRRNVRRAVEDAALATLHTRHLGSPPAVTAVMLDLEPPHGPALWRQPLPLSFPALRWSHGGLELALVPALGLEVFADKAEELLARLPTEIRAALSRDEALNLRRLVGLQRAAHLKVEPLSATVPLRGPKARALAAERVRERTPSVLKQVATNLTRVPAEPTYEQTTLLGQLAEFLGARKPRGVLLVGPSGVGKTALVRELARRRAEYGLAATPFWASSGARLVAGMSGYGMWQQRCQDVVREAARTRAVVHLGNLVELMQVGKSEHSALGIAAFLRPHLVRGELIAVCECTPEQLPLVEREDPHLLGAFQQLSVTEPDLQQGRVILQRFAAESPAGPRQPLPPLTLDTLDQLHRRYATYSAYPGRPLRFLRNLLHDTAGTAPRPADVLAAFTRETGLPRVLLDPALPLDLEQARRWFAGRVIGQPEAVDLVVELLATAKAGLTRPRKPIASLLFIGPTGVGKTEMAKALAEFLFGSARRLTRFDMSEFADPAAVQRLAGGVFGSEGLLTARVREQPFSVLLFDEFEKAHALFYDLLLQVLGEGRLTDAAGRLADFCNTVIILTSNLGAESFRQGAFGFGEAGAATAEQRRLAREHFGREVEAFLRPELFNRIERLVPFAPLAADVIEEIAGRHLQRLEGRDGIRYRGAALRCGPEVAAHLARAGFDPRYGARPLLRTVERELLAPLAGQMNRYAGEPALNIDVNLSAAGLQVKARPRPGAGRDAQAGAALLTEAARACVALRRQVQALERSPSVRTLSNELFRLEQEQERFEKGQRRHAARQARLARAPEEVRRRLLAKATRVTAADQERMAALARLRELAGRVRDTAARGYGLEDRTLQALYAERDAVPNMVTEVTAAVRELRQNWEGLLLTFYCREFPSPDLLTLSLFGEEPLCLLELAAAYLALARKWGLAVEMLSYHLPAAGKPKEAADGGQASEPAEGEQVPEQFWREDRLMATATARQPARELMVREEVRSPAALFATSPAHMLGLALCLRGPGAAPRFAEEAGLHLFRSPKAVQAGKCLVEASDSGLRAYVPPRGISRRGALEQQTRRRVYDRGTEVIDDLLLAAKLPWQNRPLDIVLAEVMGERLRRNMLALLEE